MGNGAKLVIDEGHERVHDGAVAGGEVGEEVGEGGG
jgi:hypothetical protein